MESDLVIEEAARSIINFLAQKKCTTGEANLILRYVRNAIEASAIVQKVEDRSI